MKQVKCLKSLCIIIIYLLLVIIGAAAFEKNIVLGTQDDWSDFIFFERIHLEPGKWGYYDLILEDAEYEIERETDYFTVRWGT